MPSTIECSYPLHFILYCLSKATIKALQTFFSDLFDQFSIRQSYTSCSSAESSSGLSIPFQMNLKVSSITNVLKPPSFPFIVSDILTSSHPELLKVTQTLYYLLLGSYTYYSPFSAIPFPQTPSPMTSLILPNSVWMIPAIGVFPDLQSPRLETVPRPHPTASLQYFLTVLWHYHSAL